MVINQRCTVGTFNRFYQVPGHIYIYFVAQAQQTMPAHAIYHFEASPDDTYIYFMHATKYARAMRTICPLTYLGTFRNRNGTRKRSSTDQALS